MKNRVVSVADILPRDLPSLLVEHSRIGLGLDVATTTKAKSNPSSLAVVEKIGMNYFTRLIMRWKTADPEISEAIILGVLMIIAPRRPVGLAVDFSNEKYFGVRLKKRLSGICPVKLIVASEKTLYLGESMTFKSYQGNLLINDLEEGRFTLPDEVWVKNDFRLVTRSGGSFETDVDAEGNHGDTFDAVKHARYILDARGGPVELSPCGVGQFNDSSVREGIRNPYARYHETQHRSLC